MSVKGKLEEGIGYIEEESAEKLKKSSNPKIAEYGAEKAQAGRDLRNKGRIEDHKAPKLEEPGTGHPEA